MTDEQLDSLKERNQEADEILADVGMKVHKWIYSREDEEPDLVELGSAVGSLAEDDIELERVLGIKWNPGKDVFKFMVSINLHPMKKKARSGPPLTKVELMTSPPAVITCRQYYSQVQADRLLGSSASEGEIITQEDLGSPKQ